MNYIKLLGKSFIYIISILVVSTILVTLLNFINLFGPKLMTISKIIIPVVSLFVGGFIVGKNSKQKGWLEGLKLNLIVLGLLLIINYLILKQNWDFRNIIFYLILTASTIFGSMVGINKKVENINK